MVMCRCAEGYDDWARTFKASHNGTQSSPDFRGPLCRCSVYCTCHAKWNWRAPRAALAAQKGDGGAPSAAPATQTQPASTVITQSSPDFRGPLWRCSTCCTCHRKWDWGTPSAAPATQTQPAATVITQSSPDFRGPLWRCSTCCTCHAKWDWGAPSAAPATQNETEVL